ncbi:chromosome segregation protein SMC [Candidatus Woesearchaeota archaeon]|nr:chromosome segregation protein SMC [Candidatus Woesearchaeota archaeon]
MTKINRMVMKGFKSFNQKTEILFGNEFNCILGPNGSGKSNVLDSLCFVLGKGSAKALRAEKSSNLIYNGGKKKQPSSQGEVSIYFDNKNKIFPSTEEEIKITRIIKKNGNSVYKISDKTRTRNQVLDLLAAARINPDGYNIVLQGDIIKFTEMSTEKRRKLVEEIAGISVYEEKKQKAVRELDRVEERLNGAEIILKEKQTHLRELKKDRDQALKYKDLNDKIRHNKASYLKIQIERKEAEKEELTERKNIATTEFEKHNNIIEKLKKENEEKKRTLDEIAHEIEQKGEKEQVQLSKQLETLRIDIAKNRERINSCKNEIERISQRRDQLDESYKEIDGKITNFDTEKSRLQQEINTKEKEKEQVNGSIEKFKQKNKLGKDLEQVDQEVEGIDSRSEELQKSIDELREKQQELIREKDKLEFMCGSVDERIKKGEEIDKEHKKELDDLKRKREEFKHSTLELNKKLNEDSTLAASSINIKRELAGYEEELSKLSVRQAGLKEVSMQNHAVQRILDNKELGKVYGTVSQLGSVSSKYSTALEIAAGGRINSLIVEDDSVAARCIKFLKERKHGVATFLPLNKLKSVEINSEVNRLKSANGVVDLAINLVSFDNKFKKAFSYVLGNTLIVNDVEVGRRVGIGKARMVTLEGDVIETSGAMQGGFRGKRKGIGFNEVEVGRNITTLEEKVGNLRAELSGIMRRRDENEELIQKLRSRKAELEGEIIKMEKSLHIEDADMESSLNSKKEMGTRIKEVENEIEKVQDTITEKNRELAQLKIQKQNLKTKISELRNPTVLAELNTLEEKRKQLNDSINEINSEIKGLNTQVSSIFEPEKENIVKILKQHDKETSSFAEEIESLNKVIKGQNSEIKEKEEKEKKFYSKFKALFNKRNQTNEELTKNESRIDKLDENRRKAEHKMNTISLEEARTNAEYSGLIEDFDQYKEMKVKITKTEEELKKEINDFERMKDNLGGINMRALEIYTEVEIEFHKLVDKKNVLMNEKEKVMNMMEEIEGKKKELFMNTFEVVNKNFINKFHALSTKGDAFLELENKENPFEAGVAIKVKLSGKKFMDIRGLSGGEKTMTALAFIFAIQEHEPGSFYILDEVDAALDKHNSEKLAQLVRSYCNGAQYIVISHNDSVIGEADNLYGVSMNEHGISKITSLKI